MEDAQSIFIQNLKMLRKSKKISQLQLAEKAGLSSGIIGEIETGNRNPTLTTINKIARALEVPVKQLFYDGYDTIPERGYSDKEEIRVLVHKLIDEALDM